MRQAIRWASALVLGAVGGALAFAQPTNGVPQDTFKIAVVVPFSGVYGIHGQSIRRGMEIAMEERGGKVLGKPLELTWNDDDSKPQVGVQKATQAIAGGAQVIFGSVSSPVSLALMSVAAQNKVPHIVTGSADDRITGSDRSRYTFRTANPYNMEMRMTMGYIEAAGFKTLYAIGPDVGAARDAWAGIQADLKRAGVTVAGESFLPLGTNDFSVAVDKIMKSAPDGVISFFTGGDSVTFTRQATAVGLRNKSKLFGPTAYDETTNAALGASAIGLQSGVRYSKEVDNASNRRFVAAYNRKFKEDPPVYAGIAYNGFAWLLDTIDATKSWDRERWIAAFETSKRPESVQGPEEMRACDHQAIHDGLWAEVVANPANPSNPLMKLAKTFPAARLYGPCGGVK
ncbi:ABC transporter substrate-binding protein [Variovorax defluvii]|uniref:ABC transporter substrate-binding protein n=1 Tax=Variovorax defluvii TaxID=913761 RepID=A0ABP8HEY6_9BURK